MKTPGSPDADETGTTATTGTTGTTGTTPPAPVTARPDPAMSDSGPGANDPPETVWEPSRRPPGRPGGVDGDAPAAAHGRRWVVGPRR